MNKPSRNNQITRSSFVTTIAWFFIITAGFTTIISLLQMIMINSVFPIDEMQKNISSASGKHAMPAFAEFMFANIRLIIFAFLVVCIVTFVSAVGLLKRKNWARVIFIGLMAVSIVWNIGGLFFQMRFVSLMPQMPADAPQEFQSQFEMIANIVKVSSVVMAVAFSVLFGWIIKRLMSPAVRQEFS